jgi:hypothetical protein
LVIATDVLSSVAETIAILVESIGVAIVGLGVCFAGFRYVAGLLSRARPLPPEGLRLALGSSLALSLEFAMIVGRA